MQLIVPAAVPTSFQPQPGGAALRDARRELYIVQHAADRAMHQPSQVTSSELLGGVAAARRAIDVLFSIEPTSPTQDLDAAATHAAEAVRLLQAAAGQRTGAVRTPMTDERIRAYGAEASEYVHRALDILAFG